MHLPKYVWHMYVIQGRGRQRVKTTTTKNHQHWNTKHRKVKVIKKAEDELEEGIESTHSAVL